MKQFNVIIYNINKNDFEPYDVIPYLHRQLHSIKNKSEKPTTLEEMMEFVKKWAMYQWWSRCEYEIILSDWPNTGIQKKWDVYKQVMMNLPIIANILMTEK